MSKLTSELTQALAKIQGMHIASESDLKEFQEARVLIQQIQHQTQRLNDWEAVGELKQYMQENQIDRVDFGCDYASDDQGGGSMYLTVSVEFIGPSVEGLDPDEESDDDEDQDEYAAQEAIQDMFCHRDAEAMDGMSVHFNRIDAFIKELVGEDEFARHEKFILERTAKAASSVAEPARV